MADFDNVSSSACARANAALPPLLLQERYCLPSGPTGALLVHMSEAGEGNQSAPDCGKGSEGGL